FCAGVRHSDAVRRGLHRRNLDADARGHPVRRAARLPHQAARHHAARSEGNRAAGPSDAGSNAAPVRQRRRGDECGPGQGRRGRPDALLRCGRRQPADGERGGRRSRRCHSPDYRRPRAPGASPCVPARSPLGRPDPADRRSGDVLLPAHAGHRPARRARRHHPHPRGFDDLDRCDGAKGAGRRRAARRHRHAHAPRAREEHQCGDRAHREAAQRSGKGDADSPGSAALVRYVSTRGAAQPKGFTEILLEGLASDGGLYLPQAYPAIDLAALRGKSYPALAFEILSRFMDDVPDLRSVVERTYSRSVFGSDEVTPLTTLEPGLHLLGLSNGPTLAFKDVAMQLIGPLFEQTLAARGATLNILGATSGDTGSAAEHAMRGRAGIHVYMLSPQGRMSAFQRAQMYALQDPNIHNLAVKGTFDDCQRVVKDVNADAAFKARYHVGAVNSINWARVAAQVVYYFKGYFAAT